MVILSKIYTKTGDGGQTRLGDGTRVSKADRRIAAYGSVDELNAVVGLVRLSGVTAEQAAWLKDIQQDLFDVGADLCLPARPSPRRRQPLRVDAAYAARLERAIDMLNARLRPLRSFVLPGGTAASAWLHLARTVCRRAEREVVRLHRRDPINPHLIVYLNRLSDWLFVMARVANEDGRRDLLWEPGKTRGA